MPKGYGIFNLFLSLLIFILAFKNYEIWIKPDPGPMKKEEGKRSEAKGETYSGGSISKPSAPFPSLLIISEKNIFHPERREFVSINPEQPRPLNRPQIQLQGVLITEEVQSASLILQGKSLPKGEKASKTLSLGDQIGDYKLTKILPDRIVLEAPGDVYEVLLYDLKSPKKRIEVRTPTHPAASPQPAPASPRPAAPTQTTSPLLHPGGGLPRGTQTLIDQPPLPKIPTFVPPSSPREKQIPLPKEPGADKN